MNILRRKDSPIIKKKLCEQMFIRLLIICYSFNISDASIPIV